MRALQAERHRRRTRSEDGFTLIELLIVLVILPLVTGAIAMVLVTTLKNQQGIQGRVTDSAAAAASSEFYARDVQSAGSVTTTANPSSAPSNCPLVGATGTSTFLLGIQLQGTSPPTQVAYYMVKRSQGAPLLVRDSCTNNGSLNPLSHQILSDNLNSSDPPVPVVNCISPPPTSIPNGVTCNPGQDWTFTYMVSTVSLNVTQGCAPDVASCAPYQFALTGDPQSGVPVPPVVQPCGVLTLLGNNPGITFGAFTSGLKVAASGPIVFDSGYNTGANPAIQGGFFTNTVTATSSASCPNIPAADAMEVYDCNNTAANGSSANFQACPSGSSSHNPVTGQVSVSPAPVQTVAAPMDPLATWAAQNPVTTHVTISGNGSCTTVGSTMTCTPGLYSNGLSIPNSRTVNFAKGNYKFGNSGCGASLCVGSSDVVNFGSGHYWYTNGLNVSGSGSALCGGGPVTSACANPPAGGVFFYVSGGTTALGNINFANNIQLAPITSSDPYQGKLLWQDGSDNNAVFLASAATSVNTYNGEIYVPNATISLYGFGNNITSGDVVANSINFGNFTFGFTFDVQ